MGYEYYLHTILLFFNKRREISDHKWGQCLLVLENRLVLATDLPLYSSSLSKICLRCSFIQLNRKCVARRMILTWKDLKSSICYNYWRHETSILLIVTFNDSYCQPFWWLTNLVNISFSASHWLTFPWQVYVAIVVGQFSATGVSSKIGVVTRTTTKIQTHIISLARRYRVRNWQNPL